MTHYPYRSRVEQALRALDEHPDIAITRVEVRPPATEQAIATALTYASYRLPTGVESFFRELNGLELSWESTNPSVAGGQSDQGSINILPVEHVFASWEGVVWFPDFEGGRRFRDVKPFDIFVSEACAAFVQPPGEAPGDGVVFHYFGEDVCPTGYNFDDYIDLLLGARGYLYWQLAICLDSASSPEASRIRERVSQLFPDVDVSRFAPRNT